METLDFESCQLTNLFQCGDSSVGEPRGVRQSEVRIDFQSDFYRRPILDKQIELNIDDNWRRKRASNQRLFDASKFRMYKMSPVKATSRNGEDGKQDVVVLEMKVGMTCYKDLQGTHYSEDCQRLVEAGRRLDERDPFCFMSNCIGVGALTLTSDDYLILIERANWTGESAGMVDRPGGHPEPDLVWKALPTTDPGTVPQYHLLPDQLVLKELFCSPQQELRDEVNIPLANQLEPELIGLIRDLKHGGRCSLDFLIRLDLDREQVNQRYSTGQQEEADESVGLIFISAELIRQWDLQPELIGRMSQHCLGGLKLLHLLMAEQQKTVQNVSR